MTIKELIKELKKYDENMEVYVDDYEWGLDEPISEVYITDFGKNGEDILVIK